MKPTTIFFVRHGEVNNPKDIVYLRTPRFALSERGRAEVETTAQYLRAEPIRVVYSSPMLRARQTAAIIQNYHPTAPIRISKYINEIRSSWQGISRTEMNALGWDFYGNRRQPTDESREDIVERVQRLVRLTLRNHAGEKVVWVAHGDVVILMTLWGRGLPLTALSDYRGPAYIAHGSVTKFVFEPGRELPVRVEYVNPNEVSA